MGTSRRQVRLLPMLIVLQFEYRPKDREELFNLRHAQARNAVERIFGVDKARWDILNRAPQLDLNVQAHIPAALAALHNFILQHNPADIRGQDAQLQAHSRRNSLSPDTMPGRVSDSGELRDGHISEAEKSAAKTRRDQIAQAMWEDYQRILHEGGDGLEEPA
jgi:hypothetical protein